MAAALGACSDGAEAPAAKPKAGKEAAKKKESNKEAESNGEETAIKEGDYSPIGKRDPFAAYLTTAQQSASPVKQRREQATERYELDQYRLTGVVTGTSQLRALVEDPEGEGHVVRIGSRLGRNEGRVTRITSEGIVVTEESRDALGQRIGVQRVINLPQSELAVDALE